MPSISDKVIGRLSLYQRLLYRLKAEGMTNVYSHQLASLSRGSAAQVRRDIMAIGYSGTPAHGYVIDELIKSLSDFLENPEGQKAALAGIGNLGRAILAYFSGRRPRLSITAAFDTDPNRVNRVIHGCRSYPVENMVEIIREKEIDIGIICVPAGQAQQVANSMALAGVKGILNFAPVRLQLPDDIYVEDLDVTTSLQKVAYFARRESTKNKELKK
jgi:redox-sensing transcriptional repressor